MKKNRLYTVNKWNRPAFMPEKNLFLLGGNQGQFFQHQGGGTYGTTQTPAGVAPTSFGFNTSLTQPKLPPVNWSDPMQSKTATSITGAMVDIFGNKAKSFADSFGKDSFSQPTLFTNNSGPTINSNDPGSFFGKDLSLNPEGNADTAKAVKSGFKGAAMQAAGAAALNAISSIDTGERNGLFDTLDPVHHLAGGRESGVGNALSDTGVALTKSGNPWLMLAGAGLKIVGGLTNAAFGIKEDKVKKAAADQSIKTNSNFLSNANSFDDIKGPASLTDTNVYEGGWFSGGKADRKNQELTEAMTDAYSWADRSVLNNVYNLSHDQIADFERNYAAYGGPLDFGSGALGLMQQNRYFDTIDKRSDAIANKNQMPNAFTTSAKTFADGGLKAAFMDEFGTDPIGAAVRYNQGLERMAAQKEAAEAEAAREAEQLAMQQRLASLETQNQGLQALMAAQTAPIAIAEPEPSSSPSPATPRVSSGNSTWDYVEDQLRRSGKFNDVQIEGIKYNLQRESSLNPSVVGDGGQAFGLGQWHGARKPKDMSLEGQTQHLIDTLSSYDGKMHWIGRDNYEGFLNARTPEEAHYYIARGYERPRRDIVEKVKRDSDMSLRRLKAFGGELGTNGTDFTNGLLWIGEGDSHEENPMGGVPLGVDAEGIPNLVEEGETIYNNYVFSDRMEVPDFMYKELGLGGNIKKKGKGMSFADASKKLAQESEQRPNDPISQDGLEASLSRLAEVQEAERMKQQAEEYMGLEGYACGGKMGRKYENAGPLNLYKNTGFGLDFNRWLGNGQVTPSMFDWETWMKINNIKSGDSSYQGNKPRTQPRVDTPTGGSNGRYGQGETNGPAVKRELPPLELPTPGSVTFVPKAPTTVTKDDVKGLADNVKKARDDYERRVGEEYDPYPTWMRYAPVWGAGIMSLTDMLGITNNPDYTMADKIEAAANGAAYAPNIQYKPIGDYMRYNPLDRQYYINQLMANSRATDRALVNTSSPSRAAGLLANGYNTTLSLGNLARQAEEYNRGQYERTKEFNRKTNMFNSQLDLEAAMANARYRQQAQQLGLSGLAQAAALRDSIDARTGAAKAANLSNFFTSLGNIGRENFALNQINSDRSRQYGMDTTGSSHHKRSSKDKKGSKWTSNG